MKLADTYQVLKQQFNADSVSLTDNQYGMIDQKYATENVMIEVSCEAIRVALQELAQVSEMAQAKSSVSAGKLAQKIGQALASSVTELVKGSSTSETQKTEVTALVDGYLKYLAQVSQADVSWVIAATASAVGINLNQQKEDAKANKKALDDLLKIYKNKPVAVAPLIVEVTAKSVEGGLGGEGKGSVDKFLDAIDFEDEEFYEVAEESLNSFLKRVINELKPYTDISSLPEDRYLLNVGSVTLKLQGDLSFVLDHMTEADPDYAHYHTLHQSVDAVSAGDHEGFGGVAKNVCSGVKTVVLFAESYLASESVQVSPVGSAGKEPTVFERLAEMLQNICQLLSGVSKMHSVRSASTLIGGSVSMFGLSRAPLSVANPRGVCPAARTL